MLNSTPSLFGNRNFRGSMADVKGGKLASEIPAQSAATLGATPQNTQDSVTLSSEAQDSLSTARDMTSIFHNAWR